MGVAHMLEYSWVRLLASKLKGACSVYLEQWHGGCHIAYARSLSVFCLPIPAVLPVSYGSQLPLLVAVAVLGGLDEVC